MKDFRLPRRTGPGRRKADEAAESEEIFDPVASDAVREKA
jgi:hypothetical protein